MALPFYRAPPRQPIRRAFFTHRIRRFDGRELTRPRLTLSSASGMMGAPTASRSEEEFTHDPLRTPAERRGAAGDVPRERRQAHVRQHGPGAVDLLALRQPLRPALRQRRGVRRCRQPLVSRREPTQAAPCSRCLRRVRSPQGGSRLVYAVARRRHPPNRRIRDPVPSQLEKGDGQEVAILRPSRRRGVLRLRPRPQHARDLHARQDDAPPTSHHAPRSQARAWASASR
jgi:hypothetical protein